MIAQIGVIVICYILFYTMNRTIHSNERRIKALEKQLSNNK